MLDKVASQRADTGFGNAARPDHWQPLAIPQLSRAEIEFRRRLYRRRAPKDLPLSAGALTLAPAWQGNRVDIAAPWTIALTLDGDPCRLVISEASVKDILGNLPIPRARDWPAPSICGLLVEHVLTDALAVLEPLLETRVDIQAAQKGAFQPEKLDFAPIPVEVALGATKALVLFYGNAKSMERFVQIVERASMSAPPMDLEVGANIRWAAVELSLSELRSLSPGDIVMVDNVMSGQQSALAVVGEHLFAPVKVVPDGFKLLASIKPIAGSGVEWCSARKREAMTTLRGNFDRNRDVPIRIYFELARFKLPTKTLRSVGPGKVIGTGFPFGTHVDIVAEGRHIGKGDPVTLGGGLGVRITAL